MSDQINKKSEEINQLNKKIDSMQKEFNELVGKNKSLIVILQERDKTVEELNKTIVDLRRIRDELTAEIKKLQSEKDDLDNNHTHEKNKVAEERDQLQGRVFSFGKQVEDQQEEIKKSAFNINLLNKEKDTLSKLKEALSAENSNKSKSIEDLTKKVNELAALLAARDESLKKAEADIKGLTMVKNKLLGDIDNLKKDKENMDSNNKRHAAEVQNKENIIKDLIAKNEELIKILKQRDQTIEALTKELDDLKKNKNILTNARDSLFNDNKSLAEQL